MADIPENGNYWRGRTETTVEGLCERMDKTEASVERVYERIRSLEVRMAFYIGAVAVIVWALQYTLPGK